jgi:hypothetical protein
LRNPHLISKTIFVLGCYKFLVMLEGKIRKGPSFLGFNAKLGSILLIEYLSR